MALSLPPHETHLPSRTCSLARTVLKVVLTQLKIDNSASARLLEKMLVGSMIAQLALLLCVLVLSPSLAIIIALAVFTLGARIIIGSLDLPPFRYSHSHQELDLQFPPHHLAVVHRTIPVEPRPPR